jgi:hypothetical protein
VEKVKKKLIQVLTMMNKFAKDSVMSNKLITLRGNIKWQ